MTSPGGSRASVAVAAIGIVLALMSALPADGKKKAVHCRHGQVVVKVQGKPSCRAFKKAFPKPRAGDPRLSFAKTAVAPHVKLVTRTPEDLKGAAGAAARRGIATIRRILPQVLAKIDAQATGAHSAAVARAGCSDAGPQQTSSASIGGSSVSITTGDSLAATMSVDAGAYRIIVDMNLGSPCDGFKGPSCPTAAGVLEARDSNGFRVSTKVLHGAEVVADTTVSLKGKEVLEGKVADDAKLDTLDVQDKVRYAFTVKGISAEATIRRHALIDMRSGLWLPENAAVNVSFLMSGGADLGPAVRNDLRNQLARDYDASFPEIVRREMEQYRGRETAWQMPNTCAKLAFDPASDSLQPLIKGASGSLIVTTVATSDGGKARGKWTIESAQNGTITPPTAQGPSGTFTWTVTKAGNDVKLTGSFSATSRAGVAKDSWSQPTSDLVPVLRIAGNFTGTATVQGAIYDFNGGATFTNQSPGPFGANGSYKLTAGNVTVHAGGNAGAYGYNCTMSGSKNINLQNGSMSVVGSAPTGLAPYSYDIHVPLPPTESTMDVTLSSCADPNANDMQITVGISGSPIDTGSETFPSPDGLDYHGHHEDTDNGGTYSVDWTMVGDTNP